MSLEEIAAAAGTTTTRQRNRGVAVVDGTSGSLADRLRPVAGELPCAPAAAAAVLRSYGTGTPIEECAQVANLAPVTASKVLHRLGVPGVSPLAPTARRIVRDWIRGEVSRADALALTDASSAEFALAAYIESHEPLPGAREITGEVTGLRGDAMVAKRDHLGETLDGSPKLP
jgi:hypothetical protein